VQSILFKYALDTAVLPGLWMYGGDFPDDASAMKAAGARSWPVHICQIA
jgi:hypothetical protein